MLKKISEVDRFLFLKINQESKNNFFDTIMPFIREAIFWAPLYLFILLFVLINFGKKAIWWVFSAAATVALTDTISSKIIKPFFARPRPCLDPEFSAKVRLLANYCGGNGSFTSSHAANHFGLAMFIFITLRHVAPKTVWLFFGWAALICFAQIYVGVHYPTDVAGGAVLGMLTGYGTAKILIRKTGLLRN